MRVLRIALIVILVVVTVLFGVTAVIQNLDTSGEAPTIACSSDVLELSVKDGEDVLLTGVTASDKQDGDLTAEIRISGISKFTNTETATANVTYLVFDSDGNMASLTRTIRYTDYTAPQFSISEPLSYKSSENIVLLDRLTASDCIDGDITDSIRVSSLEPTTTDEIFAITVQVTNSMGDTSELELELFWQIDNADRPQIELTRCMVSLPQGGTFDPSSYVSHISTASGTVSKSMVKISNPVDTSQSGVYSVHYSYTDSNGTGVSILTVVVE